MFRSHAVTTIAWSQCHSLDSKPICRDRYSKFGGAVGPFQMKESAIADQLPVIALTHFDGHRFLRLSALGALLKPLFLILHGHRQMDIQSFVDFGIVDPFIDFGTSLLSTPRRRMRFP